MSKKPTSECKSWDGYMEKENLVAKPTPFMLQCPALKSLPCEPLPACEIRRCTRVKMSRWQLLISHTSITGKKKG